MNFTPIHMMVLALQALVAAIFEEQFAVNSSKNGFRDGNGKYRSKKYAILRLMAGVGGIAIAVQFVPYVVDSYFTHPIIQGIGAAIIASVILAHTAVESWKIRLDDVTVMSFGGLLIIVPYLMLIV